jgi:hypothetical protein
MSVEAAEATVAVESRARAQVALRWSRSGNALRVADGLRMSKAQLSQPSHLKFPVCTVANWRGQA